MSRDGADMTWSGREFQTDGPEIVNDRSLNLLDLGTTSLLWLLVAERKLEQTAGLLFKSSKFNYRVGAHPWRNLCTSSTCIGSSLVHGANAQFVPQNWCDVVVFGSSID